MPECLSNVPWVDGVCVVTRGIAPGRKVSKNLDGTMNPNWSPAEIYAASRSGRGVQWPYQQDGKFSYDAMMSAWEMLDEHDQRIRDGDQMPSNIGRGALWESYYRVSLKQFVDDAVKLSQGKKPQIIFSTDGIAPYPPQRLADLAVDEAIGRIKTSDQRALDEIIRVYGPTRTAAEISEKLATNPFAARFLQMYMQAVLGPLPTFNPAAPPDTVVITGTAPMPTLDPINRCVKRNSALPPSLSNCLSQSEVFTLAAREAGYEVAIAPEWWRESEAAEAAIQAETRDFFYWKANYPDVRLVAEQNPGLRADELFVPWPGPGLAPLVIVQITPRQRPLPQAGVLMKMPWLSALASLIPFVGGIVAAGLSYATNDQIKKWAGSWRPNDSEFAPQFYPQPFGVPMPLDRAQIMRDQPWYAAAMVNQFAEDVRTNTLRQASEAYAALFGAMGASGQNQLTTASVLPTVQGAASLGIASNNSQAPSGSALPLFLAGALLVAGAPIVVPVAVLFLMSKKS